MASHRKIRGIQFYPMEVDHTSNKRVRLLYNDLGSDGYWIWSCLIDSAYKTYGYYYPATGEDIELISAMVCHKPPELVWKAVESCVKRGLFDQVIYEKQAALTNDKMQMNYIRGTYERRRKGYIISFHEKHFLIPNTELVSIGDKFLDNVVFIETGKTLTGKIADSADTPLFSAEKNNSSAEKEINSEEKGHFSKRERERERERDIMDTKVSTADAGVVGIKSESKIETKKNAPPKKKIAQKKKGRNPDAEPYWHVLRRVWVDFNRTHVKFNVEPIPEVDYSHMHRIIENLRERATGQAVVWTEPEAVMRFTKFLTVAYTQVEWLHEHFELANLMSKRQTIFKLVENGKSETNLRVNGHAKQSTSDSKINALANWSIGVPSGNQAGKG